MRVLVCGGRDYDDYDHVRTVLYKFCDDNELWHEPDQYGNSLPKDLVIIHGGAKGADSLADQWAVVNWVPFEEYKPDWDRYGKSAGPIRNQQMLDKGKPDVVIAFPGGRGTAHMIGIAKKAGVPVIES
jgi:hypothetical protein